MPFDVFQALKRVDLRLRRFAATQYARRLEITLWLAVAPLSVWLWFWPQPPGTAGIILAAWGGVIAVLEFGAIRRALAVIMIVLLMVLELHSIYHDRDMTDRARIAEQKNLNDEFANILKENRVSLANTESHFESVLEQLNDVAKDITGGNSFAYVVPQDHEKVKACKGVPKICVPVIPLVVHNGGDQPLINVSIIIIDFAKFPGNALDSFYGSPPIIIGVLSPHGYQEINGLLPPDIQADGMARYWIFLRAQNGEVQQILRIRKGKNDHPWGSAYEVSKQIAVPGKPGTWKNKMLLSIGWTDEPHPASINPPTASPPTQAPQDTPAGK